MAHAAAGHPRVRLGHRKLLFSLVTTLAVFVVLLVAAAAIARPKASPSCQQQICSQPPPPTGQPVVTGQEYRSSAFGYSLIYDQVSNVSTTSSGIQLGFSFKNGAAGTDTLVVSGRSAAGNDPQSIVQSIESSQFPNAVAAYILPGAYIGYQLGYGVAFDQWSNNADGSQSEQRVILMAAVKGNVAIVVMAFGHHLVLNDRNGFASHPTGADLPVAAVADPIINSISWPA